MGQYYNIVIKEKGSDTIDAYDRTLDGKYTMAKLMEHSWYLNDMVNAICKKLYNKPSQIAWVGDYSNDINEETYKAAYGRKDYKKLKSSNFNLNTLFIVNHDKKQILDVWSYVCNCARHQKDDWIIHPLPLLTAIGNGAGGGDYRGVNMDKVGIWAWDTLEIVEFETFEKLLKDGYSEMKDLYFSEEVGD